MIDTWFLVDVRPFKQALLTTVKKWSFMFKQHLIDHVKNRSVKIKYCSMCIPCSQKYWQELNLAVEPKIAIERILADFNLAVRYGIAIRIYSSRKFWRILIWRL